MRSEPIIEPIYWQSNPSEPIDLGQHAIELTSKGTTYEDVASIVMKFLPHDRVEIVCPWKDKPPLLGQDLFSDSGDSLKLTLRDKGASFDVFCASFSMPSGGSVFVPRSSGVTVTTGSESISRVTFHLFNFPDFLGPEDYTLTTKNEEPSLPKVRSSCSPRRRLVGHHSRDRPNKGTHKRVESSRWLRSDAHGANNA